MGNTMASCNDLYIEQYIIYIYMNNY